MADDHPAVLEAVSAVLGGAGWQVTECGGGRTALETIRAAPPDVAVLDPYLGDLSGLEVLRQAWRSGVRSAAVMFTASASRALLTEALDTGVLGVVLKTSPPADLVRAVECAQRGERWIDPGLAAALLSDGEREEGSPLTKREREVLRLLADGFANDEIGKRLYIAPDTVRTHIRRSIAKLGASNRTHAVALALRQSLIE